MTKRILITPRSLQNGEHPALVPLREAGFELVSPAPGKIPSEADLLAVIPQCIGWLAGVEPVSEAVIAAAKNLRIVSRNGTGVDNLPLAALKERGIEVRRAQDANARSVAELALGLTLAGLRDIVPAHLGMRRGEWPRRIGTEILGAEIGVLGLGAIGTSFAKFCLDLGAKVRGHDPFAPQDRITHPNFTRAGLAETIGGAMVVSLHAPLPADGRPLMGATQFDSLARGAILVNTARSGLVDEAALLAALERGQVGTYATDVYDTEPPEPSPLLSHRRVVTTTHIGGFTETAVERSTRYAVENLLDVLAARAG